MISIFLGGVLFLFAFSWFKEATTEIFKKDLESAADDSKSHRSYLLKIFFFDYVICMLGVVFTGILFLVIFNIFQYLQETYL
jgi:flagellar biosynthesis protein FlhB